MDYVNLTGKITINKESDKFSPINRQTYDSGWRKTKVSFNCISDTNRVPCVIDGGCWENDSKNGVVKTFSKNYTKSDGTVVKGEKIEIPWNKRFDQDQIDKVVGYRKFTVQLGEEKHEFITEYDFAEFVANMIESKEYDDTVFNISGYYDIQYYYVKDSFYTRYHVTAIYTTKEDAEPKAELKLKLFYGEDAVDDSMFEDTGKAYLNGYVQYYDNAVKANGFKSVSLVIPESKLRGAKRKFAVDGEEFKSVGIIVDIFEGVEHKPLTKDMLSEEDLLDLEDELITWEELEKAYGETVAGDRISELRYRDLNGKDRVVQDTTFTKADMHPARAKVDNVPFPDIDIFDDDL